MPTTPTLTVRERSCSWTDRRPCSTALRMRSPSARPAESGVSRATTPNGSRAQPGQHVLAPHRRFHQTCNEPQGLLAGRAAEGLDHPHEAVHLDSEQRHGPGVALGGDQLRPQPVVEVAPVEEAGLRVEQRALGEPALVADLEVVAQAVLERGVHPHLDALSVLQLAVGDPEPLHEDAVGAPQVAKPRPSGPPRTLAWRRETPVSWSRMSQAGSRPSTISRPASSAKISPSCGPDTMRR